ncbi:hypothetical protein D3C85_1920560 [compost metagenome]
MATGIDDLEPVHVAHGLGALGQGVADGILDAQLGGADNFDLLVGAVIGHAASPQVGLFLSEAS